ncbi:NAD-dependent epimerase/dehydratase [Denitrovibrio acetiphilus DSM 12809]|uniref:NAD-dependent epimerase/dehydratase n=1 Tax=Denitrovibrio acetiphilus (strain DSM 12809 / NBRC 114555 / N2460) TaxID=522772 RepID=D4H3Q1_DENA2|nr:NAD-dependent epimerase [Denitrovibrio acetiphilus]ADD69153.1 NAD-dependent epimerase/dehydratase [Denitrovibrio acetiphilus DSM 12809]
MKILVTGTAGFIGHHTALKLALRGDDVIGLDNINDYYDVRVKYGRLKNSGIIKNIADGEFFPYAEPVRSSVYPTYRFVKINLEDRENITKLFETEKFDAVCHLAAQAGVRYSIDNPHAYIKSNIDGFMNILESCRHTGVKNLCFASSSSVYGLNKEIPFKTSHSVDHPISLYAATKKSNEMMAHTYSHLFDIHTTGLRFFTVYGPWGRPDMALFIFTKAALEGKPINVFNNGEMFRDFTYIDDIVEGVVRVLDNPAKPDADFNGTDPSTSSAPYKIYNIGNSVPVNLMDFIKAIEAKLGKTIEKNMMPIQPGDLHTTYADASDLTLHTGYKPSTSIEDGVGRFIDWYLDFYDIKL